MFFWFICTLINIDLRSRLADEHRRFKSYGTFRLVDRRLRTSRRAVVFSSVGNSLAVDISLRDRRTFSNAAVKTIILEISAAFVALKSRACRLRKYKIQHRFIGRRLTPFVSKQMLISKYCHHVVEKFGHRHVAVEQSIGRQVWCTTLLNCTPERR